MEGIIGNKDLRTLNSLSVSSWDCGWFDWVQDQIIKDPTVCILDLNAYCMDSKNWPLTTWNTPRAIPMEMCFRIFAGCKTGLRYSDLHERAGSSYHLAECMIIAHRHMKKTGQTDNVIFAYVAGHTSNDGDTYLNGVGDRILDSKTKLEAYD